MRPDVFRVTLGCLFFLGAASAPRPAAAQAMGERPLQADEFQEESRFLPGLYYFHKALEHSKRGETDAAIRDWETAAEWAMKPAQYNLGIAYFKGQGVTKDRPRGLAWLALAAERKDAAFQESLAAAWDDATSAEHDRANALWRELKDRYGDATALPRAKNRFNNEINQLSGSRVGMPGNAKISSAAGTVNASTYRARMEHLAEANFGKSELGGADVDPLESADAAAKDSSDPVKR